MVKKFFLFSSGIETIMSNLISSSSNSFSFLGCNVSKENWKLLHFNAVTSNAITLGSLKWISSNQYHVNMNFDKNLN